MSQNLFVHVAGKVDDQPAGVHGEKASDSAGRSILRRDTLHPNPLLRASTPQRRHFAALIHGREKMYRRIYESSAQFVVVVLIGLAYAQCIQSFAIMTV